MVLSFDCMIHASLPAVLCPSCAHPKQHDNCRFASYEARASVCRFNYSQEFLQWALQPPGYQADWVLGVRVSSSGKLVAFITGVPATVRYGLFWLFQQRKNNMIASARKHLLITVQLGHLPPTPCQLILPRASMMPQCLYLCS